jgi:hypothetical protein
MTKLLAGPRPVGLGTDETSQLLCRRLPDMRRVSDRVGSLHGWRLTPCVVLPSASLNSVGIPEFGFRGSIPGLPVSPVNASATPSRASLHDLGAVMLRHFFSVSNFHRLSPASFAGALSVRRFPLAAGRGWA